VQPLIFSCGHFFQQLNHKAQKLIMTNGEAKTFHFKRKEKKEKTHEPK